MDADVVIVGAGPAGCAAAYDLAVKGIRVLLMDRTEFPRPKTCAGGVTIKTVRALRYPIWPVIQRSVSNLRVSCRMRHPKLLGSLDPICHLVDRTAFDLHCLNRTLAAGTSFAIVNRIESIAASRRCVKLVTDCGVIRSAFIIGADGVHSRVRQLTRRFEAIRFGFAVEGVVDRMADTLDMGFDFNLVKGGYGWVFPKKEYVNVGLYSCRSDIALFRRDLVDYAARRLSSPSPKCIRGFPLGLGGWRYRPGRGRVLLVGDAAGLVDPLLGEGLYHAITSGQRAAAAIVQALDDGTDACRSYAKMLTPIQQDLLFTFLASNFFYRLPIPGHLLLTSPAAGPGLMQGFSQGLPLFDIFRRGCRYWFAKSGSAHRKQKSF